MKLSINDRIVEIPVYHPDMNQTIYLLKRAIEHDDVVAREMLLGGEPQRHIFIGDGDFIRWVLIKQDTVELIEKQI